MLENLVKNPQQTSCPPLESRIFELIKKVSKQEHLDLNTLVYDIWDQRCHANDFYKPAVDALFYKVFAPFDAQCTKSSYYPRDVTLYAYAWRLAGYVSLNVAELEAKIDKSFAEVALLQQFYAFCQERGVRIWKMLTQRYGVRAEDWYKKYPGLDVMDLWAIDEEIKSILEIEIPKPTSFENNWASRVAYCCYLAAEGRK